MIDKLPGQMMEPVTEENKSSPPILEPLSGTSETEYGNKSIAEVNLRIGRHPSQITGTVPSDPRNKQTYPEDPREQVELVMPGEAAESEEEKILASEFDMQMKKSMALQSEALPPYPLTVEELSEIIRNAIPAGKDAYNIWIPAEPEVIEKTAVGKYRNLTEGSIIRFDFEHNDYFTSFLLIADYSKTGFSWYQTATTGGSFHDGLLDASNSQRLERLRREDNKNFLSTLPDRVRHASGLLNQRLTPDNKTPTPDEWLTTMCERDGEKSENFKPRYNATFVHKTEEIVIELIPLEAEQVISEIDQQTAGNDHRIKFETNDNIDSPQPGYKWEISFANEDIVGAIESQYDDKIVPIEAYKMMLDISEQIA